MAKNKANEEEFNELHSLVTTELINRLKLKSDCTTADIKAAIDWLAKNNVTGIAVEHSPLADLLESLSVDLEDVNRVVQ